MEKIRRLRFFIIAALACAILFCIAGFSVSYAKWDGADDTVTPVNSKASNFYINYPRYVDGTASKDSSNVYLEATINNEEHWNNGAGKVNAYRFYECIATEKDNGYTRQFELVINLNADDQIKIHETAHTEGDASFAEKWYEGNYSGVTEFTHTDGFPRYRVSTTGQYRIILYRNDSGLNHKIQVGRITTEEENNNSENTGDEIDTSGYTYKLSVKFTDDSQVKKLYFKIAVGAGDGFNNLDNLSAYIRGSNNNYYFNLNGHGGNGSTGDGNFCYVHKANGNTINVGTKADTVVAFAFDELWITDSGTSTASNYNDVSNLKLATLAVDEINLITLHKAKGGTPTRDNGGSGSGSSGGSSSTGELTNLPAGTPLSGTLVDKTTVREVNAKVTGEDTTYIYHNYIAVSRRNSESTDDDNSIAYLEFEVSKSNVNPHKVKVKSLKITRRATDENGNITAGFIDPAPRVYNYDPDLDTRLGLSNEDGVENKYAIFSHGKTHDVEGKDPTKYEDIYPNMVNHYDDGVYVVLYFGDASQQYFALDIELELDQEVEFTLTAQLANTNSWERYKDGYGEPWGYYMGGLINQVETWDPSRTTKLERASDQYKTSYNEDLEKQVIEKYQPDWSGELKDVSDEAIEAFNKRADFNYKIIKFYRSDSSVEGAARYPEGKIDVSLTVNLTEKSLVKMYMIDQDGHRLKGNTVYVVPNEISFDGGTEKYFPGTVEKPIYDKDLNLVINQTGTYVFRLEGYFHTSADTVNGKSGNMIGREKGDRCDGTGVSTTYYALPNFNLFVDKLYVTCVSASDTSEFTLTLDPNGGELPEINGAEINENTGIVTVKKVLFGSSLTKYAPTHPQGWEFLGWLDDKGNEVGADSTVTKSMTLTAQWGEKYTVTFDKNADDAVFPSDAVTTAETNKYGYLTVEQINGITKPTRDGYNFLGWFTEQEEGVEISFEYHFTGETTTVYAHWEEDVITITFNANGGECATAYEEIHGGASLTLLPEATKDLHSFDGWYTAANGGDPVDLTTTFDTDTTVYAHYTATKLRIVIDASSLYEVNTDNTYHIYSYIGDGAYAEELTGGWTERLEMTSNGDGTFYCEMEKVPGNFIITLDANNTRTELGRFARNSDGLALGAETRYTVDINSLTFEKEYVDDKGVYKIGLVFNDGIVVLKANPGGWYGDIRPYYIEIKGKDTEKVSYVINYDRFTKYDYNLSDVTFIDLGNYNDSWVGGINFGEGGFAPLENGKIYSVRYGFFYEDAVATVTFDSGEGSAVEAQEISIGGKVTPPTDPERDGYKFGGWYNGDTVWNFVEDIVLGDMTLTAHWIRQYTVTFKANDGAWGDGSDEQSHKVYDGDQISEELQNNKPIRSGWTFVAWYEEGKDFEFDFDTRITGDIVLVAQWKENPADTYTITFDANGGACTTASLPTDADGKITTLPTATKDLHSFDGWFTAEGKEVTTNTVFTSTQTVTARWTADKVRIVLGTENISHVEDFDYHIHVWNDAGAITNSDYTKRPILTLKDGKYQIELDTADITGFKFTKDRKGTTTEFISYEYSYKASGTPEVWEFSKLQLGSEYTFSPTMQEYRIDIKFNNSTTVNANLYILYGGAQIHRYNCDQDGAVNIGDMTFTDTDGQLSIMFKPNSSNWTNQTGEIKVKYNSAGGYSTTSGYCGSSGIQYTILGKNVTFPQ